MSTAFLVLSLTDVILLCLVHVQVGHNVPVTKEKVCGYPGRRSRDGVNGSVETLQGKDSAHNRIDTAQSISLLEMTSEYLKVKFIITFHKV